MDPDAYGPLEALAHEAYGELVDRERWPLAFKAIWWAVDCPEDPNLTSEDYRSYLGSRKHSHYVRQRQSSGPEGWSARQYGAQ
jgi:hypothetical protein